MYFFFFNDTATTEIYTLPLHDALPISSFAHPTRRYFPRSGLAKSASTSTRSAVAILASVSTVGLALRASMRLTVRCVVPEDRKSTRLNSSHGYISYAVFCLKKKHNT